MTTVKRKSKLHHRIGFDPFLLFVISSVAIHGLVVLGFIFSRRTPITEAEEPTPIDFVVVPPEESSAEVSPDTELQADKNSVAKGNVNPESSTASDKIDSQETVATPASPPAQPQTAIVPPPTPQATPTPEPPAETSPPVTPPPPLQEPKAIESPPVTPPNEIKPNPPVEKEPKPIEPKPLARPTETANNPPLSKEPKPVINKPLLAESDTSISSPGETPSTEENIFKPDLPSKSEVTESLPQPEETPPTETENPSEPVSPVATNTPPKPAPIEPTTPANTSVPETPTPESATAVGSGSASLLEGTQARSYEDSDSTFLDTETNASQQATNTSGIDLNPYYDEIQRRVKQNWQSPASGDNRHTVLTFSIGRNGQIIGLRIRQSSGSPEVDQKSIDAVQKSGPFAPLPANYPYQQLPIEYHFTINAYIE